MKVYHARWITEDTNPWDSNESYGVWRDLEDAKDKAFERYCDDESAYSWVEVDFTYGGLDPRMRTWKRVCPDGDEDDHEGYGMYIFEEELR